MRELKKVEARFYKTELKLMKMVPERARNIIVNIFTLAYRSRVKVSYDIVIGIVRRECEKALIKRCKQALRDKDSVNILKGQAILLDEIIAGDKKGVVKEFYGYVEKKESRR